MCPENLHGKNNDFGGGTHHLLEHLDHTLCERTTTFTRLDVSRPNSNRPTSSANLPDDEGHDPRNVQDDGADVARRTHAEPAKANGQTNGIHVDNDAPSVGSRGEAGNQARRHGQTAESDAKADGRYDEQFENGAGCKVGFNFL